MTDDVTTASLFPGVKTKAFNFVVPLLLFLFAIGLFLCGLLPAACAGVIILFSIVLACCCAAVW